MKVVLGQASIFFEFLIKRKKGALLKGKLKILFFS